MFRLTSFFLGLALLALSPFAQATTFHFDTPPFGNIDVGAIPGRQIVGGEQFINFVPGADTLDISAAAFGVSGKVNFVNGPVGAVPGITTGLNIFVLDTFDNDNNPLTPFGAGQAADLIASKLTTHGAGFFIYFNQSLDLPRLVFSTDLASSDADLQIVARMINLTGALGRNVLPTITADNFEVTATPEPSAISLLGSFLLATACLLGVKQMKRAWAYRRSN